MSDRTFFQKIGDVIGFLFFQICILISKILPIQITSLIFASLAVLLCPFVPQTYLVLRNLKMAMPELSYFEKVKIMFGVWYGLGKFAGEFPYIYSFKKNKIFKYVEIDERSKNIIEEIKNNKTGSIIFSAHISNWEAGARFLLDNGVKLGIVFRKQNNPLIEPKYSANIRQKLGINMIAKQDNAAIQIIKSLKRGDNIIILADQRDELNGLLVNFFGRKAYTNSAIYFFAKKLKIPVYGMRLVRIGCSTKFKPSIEEKRFVSENDLETEFIQSINDTIERWIRETPEQWFWVHDRWK